MGVRSGPTHVGCSAPMSTMPTTTRMLGRYELLFLLGQGGMGEVHLARLSGAAGFEKLCIVKTILPQMQADPQFVDRFHHEARVLVHLTHSNIAQVYDMGEFERTLYMAIEYVPGVDLARVESRVSTTGSRMPLPMALYIGQQIAEALGYAHRKTGPDGMALGIVHRDVSPQNVMVSYEGEVKVIDFGLAKSAARSKHTLPSTVMGKLGYMSPEQALARPVDHRSDIFSAGIVVWEMIAGRPLYEGGTMAEMVAMMANPTIPSLRSVRPDVSNTLDQIVMRALAVDPAARYGRCDEFARALNELAVREQLTIGAEEVGNAVRAMCPEEFAAERQLQSKLSILRKKNRPSQAPAAEEFEEEPTVQGTFVRGSGSVPMTPAQLALSAVSSGRSPSQATVAPWLRRAGAPGGVATARGHQPSGPGPGVVGRGLRLRTSTWSWLRKIGRRSSCWPRCCWWRWAREASSCSKTGRPPRSKLRKKTPSPNARASRWRRKTRAHRARAQAWRAHGGERELRTPTGAASGHSQARPRPREARGPEAQPRRPSALGRRAGRRREARDLRHGGGADGEWGPGRNFIDEDEGELPKDYVYRDVTVVPKATRKPKANGAATPTEATKAPEGKNEPKVADANEPKPAEPKPEGPKDPKPEGTVAAPPPNGATAVTATGWNPMPSSGANSAVAAPATKNRQIRGDVVMQRRRNGAAVFGGGIEASIAVTSAETDPLTGCTVWLPNGMSKYYPTVEPNRNIVSALSTFRNDPRTPDENMRSGKYALVQCKEGAGYFYFTNTQPLR